MGKNGHGEDPQFDFNKASYGWGRDWGRVNDRIMRLSRLLEASPRENLTPEEMGTVLAAQEEAMEEWYVLLDERDALIARVLVDVPRGWLVDDAPAMLDWHDPTSLHWIIAYRMQDLVISLGEQRQGSAKNSPGRTRRRPVRRGR